MTRKITISARNALIVALGLGVSACGGMPGNRTLESVHQPVVQRNNYALDLASSASGLSLPEQRRLADWFEAMELRYGDRIAIEDASGNPATRRAVEALASRYGLLVTGIAPVTNGFVGPGMIRVVVTRSHASVPSCPNWDAKSETNLKNATSSNFGCATNSNIAAMVADPEHLIHGAKGSPETTINTSTKAIKSYRDAAPTGEKGLSNVSSTGGGQ